TSMAGSTCAASRRDRSGLGTRGGRHTTEKRKWASPVAPDPDEEQAMPFTLPPLPYPADALEAAIDKATMEIHHGKHHKPYVDNLNAALQGQAALEAKPIEQLMREISSVPEAIRQKVINNGGGHANHTMFWEIMAPSAGGAPSGTLAEAINSTFGNL